MVIITSRFATVEIKSLHTPVRMPGFEVWKKKIDYNELFKFFSHECDPQNKKLISLFVSFSIGELKRKHFPCTYENVLRAYETKSWRFWTWTKFFAHEDMFGASLLIVQKTRHLQQSVMVALCFFSLSWTVRERNDVAVELKSLQAVKWTVEKHNFNFFVGAGAKLVTKVGTTLKSKVLTFMAMVFVSTTKQPSCLTPKHFSWIVFPSVCKLVENIEDN